MGWTRCSSRAAGGWADGVRDRAGSGVDVRSCCERCHEVKAYTRHGTRLSGDQCAGETIKLELAPPSAARVFIPLRTNALIEIGMPGTCCEDRCESQLRGATPIRPRIDHASRCPIHSPRIADVQRAGDGYRQVARSALVVRGHCQSIFGPPSACRRFNEYHLISPIAQPSPAFRRLQAPPA